MGLIVLEGLDGSGKSTQLPLLEEELQRRGPVRTVSFPDYSSPSSALVKMYLGGEFGDKPGDVNAYAAGAFYAVDRYASFKKDWQRDYDKGITILAGRYATSNMIYQMEKLPRPLWEEYISWVEDFEYVKLGLPRPHRVIFLDMPLAAAQKLLELTGHTMEDVAGRGTCTSGTCTILRAAPNAQGSRRKSSAGVS